LIRLSQITKVYRIHDKASRSKLDFYALRDVSLEIEDGSIFGIIGRSGAGKSTLIRCVNMLERPTYGHVFLNDTEMTSLSGQELRNARRKIGMIFQSFNLLSNRTAFGNISFPLELAKWGKSEIIDRVREIASLVEIEDKLDHYPSQLSGGQKQRVGIARALANRPDVLLSDEATSALDPQTTKSVLRLIRDINEKLGLTVIMITHEMNVIKEICDSVAVLENGEVVESGTVLQIFSTPVKKATKDLIASVTQSDLPESLADLKFMSSSQADSDLVLRVWFFGSSAFNPIISDIVRKFDVDVNILAAQIDRISSTPFGMFLIRLSGDEHEGVIDFLLDMKFRVEVIGYVPRTCTIAY
jgi:D-methionine transport system ATP-binding protein